VFKAHDSKGGGVSGGITTDGVNTTGANFFVVGVAAYQTDPDLAHFSDNKSNTWFRLPRSSSNDLQSAIFYAYNATGGAGHTITIASGIQFPAVELLAFNAGTFGGDPFDVTKVTAFHTGTTNQAGSFTPNFNNELVVAFAATLASEGGTSCSSPFNSLVDSILFLAPSVGAYDAYEIQTTATNRNPTWTFGNSIPSDAHMISFVPGAAAFNARPGLNVKQAVNRSGTY
jgi:hypothetical protein